MLGVKGPSGEWSAQVLSKAHNGENEVEEEKVRQEHPGEDECMMDDRVLGAIAVTRGQSVCILRCTRLKYYTYSSHRRL